MEKRTTGIHGGLPWDEQHGATAVPIYQSTAYSYSTAKELADVFGGRAPGYIYTRIANPTTYALERRLAELEGGIGCIATSSGMSAISAVATGLLRSGDEIVTTSGIFGGTVSLFVKTLGRFGITTRTVSAGSAANIRDAASERTRMIFIETITNPGMEVVDIGATSEVAKELGVPLVVDSTLTPPAAARCGDLGADIVVHSLSKYINGHGTAMGGAIVDTGNYDWSSGLFDDIKGLAGRAGGFAFLAFLRNQIYRDLGGCPAPMNSFLMLQGLETLAYRMEAHCSNALKLAGFLADHGDVRWVNYPGLKDNRYFGNVAKQFGSKGGGLFTFSLGSKERAMRFIDSVRLARNLANLGDAKTLVIHPGSTIFSEFSEDKQEQMGVTSDMIRVSVGIEDYADIQEDFEQAIDKALEV